MSNLDSIVATQRRKVVCSCGQEFREPCEWFGHYLFTMPVSNDDLPGWREAHHVIGKKEESNEPDSAT